VVVSVIDIIVPVVSGMGTVVKTVELFVIVSELVVLVVIGIICVVESLWLVGVMVVSDIDIIVLVVFGMISVVELIMMVEVGNVSFDELFWLILTIVKNLFNYVLKFLCLKIFIYK